MVAQASSILGHPTKKAATIALYREGCTDYHDIAGRVGSTKEAVRKVIDAERRAGSLPAPAGASTVWTEEKTEKAVRLFDLCVDEVARQMAVPAAELRRLWTKGSLPSRAAAPAPASIPDPVTEPSRDDDEAELAKLMDEHDDRLEELDDPDPLPPVIPPVPPAPTPIAAKPKPVVAPVDLPKKNQVPVSHADTRRLETQAVGPDDIVRLIDETGRYLHESLEGMTTNPRFAWMQPRSKLKAVQNRLPHTRQLDVQVVRR